MPSNERLFDYRLFHEKSKKTSTTVNHITRYIHDKNRPQELINDSFFKSGIFGGPKSGSISEK